MKVLVTSADGFIGSHLAEALVKRGHEVRAFVLYNSLGSRGWLDHVGADVLESSISSRATSVTRAPRGKHWPAARRCCTWRR